MQDVIISKNLNLSLTQAIEKCEHDKLFVLTDTVTHEKCLPVIAENPFIQSARIIVIKDTDENKTLDSLAEVWTALSNGGGTRHSLLINLGGGMVTDLGGFAASTFKRGINYINIPTTLLSMVLKHGLISTEAHWAELIRFDLNDIDYAHLQNIVAQSVSIKENIVKEDPFEKGIRKALNLGHTAGHALESLALEEHRTVLHGYAVAWGLVCELYLSCKHTGFPKDKLRQTIEFVKNNYGVFTFDCKSYDRLYELMTHDKKNTSGHINFTLLKNVGDILINQTMEKEDILDMLDFYRESMGC